MTIFKTKYTPDQIAEHLYTLCIMDKEVASSIQDYKEGNAIENIDPKLETELRWHIYILKLVTCIYAVPLLSGNSRKETEIIHSFSKIISSSMMIRPDNDNTKESVHEEFEAYQKAIHGNAGSDELHFAIGKCFAEIMGKSNFLFSLEQEHIKSSLETIGMMNIGSKTFLELFESITDWLKKIK
jgi:hypothetical protein